MASGKDIYDLGLTRIGAKYVFGALVPKNDKTYKSPWDCAEFVSWLVYQVSGKLYGCANNNGNPATADSYTGFWARDAKSLGIIIPINQAVQTEGAALLRVSGNGQVGHIVVSDGKGGTVEAHSTKRGVIKNVTTGRRWDYGVLIPWINYTETPISNVKEINKKPEGKIYRLTSPMMRGDEIKAIQQALGIQADGVFGNQTFNAVRAFQNKNELTPDGEVGGQTLKALNLI